MSRHPRPARRFGAAVVGVACLGVVLAAPATAAWSTAGTAAGTGKATSLAAPTSLGTSAGSPSHTAINVTFTPGSNSSGTTYTVTRDKKKDGTAGPEVACSGLTASPCADSGLNASTTYTYTVRAVLGAWSAQGAGSVNRTTAAAPVSTTLTITSPSNGNTNFGRNPSAASAGTAFIGTGYATTVSATLKQGTSTIQTATPAVDQTTGAWSYATSCLAKGTSYVLTVTQTTPTGTATATSSFTTSSANPNCP